MTEFMGTAFLKYGESRSGLKEDFFLTSMVSEMRKRGYNFSLSVIS